MQIKDRYIYPAIFSYDDDGIVITFPDLPGCISQADDDQEALFMARDAMALWLHYHESENLEIPTPSRPLEIKHEAHQIVNLIDVYMPLYRESINNQYERKSVTIPQYLIIEGKREGLNFSQILQEALKNKLGLK